MTNRYLTEKDKREICSWKYDGEYSIYNLPSFEEMKKLQSGFVINGEAYKKITPMGESEFYKMVKD